MTTTASFAELAYQARARILDIGATATGTHIGGSLSAVDILTVLYGAVLRVRPDDPDWVDRDVFILSKGHASAALYAVLSAHGFFPEQECATYGSYGSRLAGHPLRRLPGVEFPTGSLGHGLSLGVGVALAAQRDGRPSRVFVLLGDGELQEGSVWEAAMSAAQLGLSNLTAIVDRNRWQISGATEGVVGLEPLAGRWASFGWSTAEVDGHDHAALYRILSDLPLAAGKPGVVIASTIKGRGVSMFEDHKKCHYVTLTPQLYQRAMAGLRASRS